jgi:hypothetical protein
MVFGVALLLFTGCACNRGASAIPGRYQTVVANSTWVIMTDTVTGQAWIAPTVQPGKFSDESFGRPKRD